MACGLAQVRPAGEVPCTDTENLPPVEPAEAVDLAPGIVEHGSDTGGLLQQLLSRRTPAKCIGCAEPPEETGFADEDVRQVE